MFRTLTGHQIAFDIVVAALFAMVALPLDAMTNSGTIAALQPTSLLTVAVVSLLFSVAVALRRFAPGIALGVAWLAAILQMLAGRPPGFSDLAVFVVLYAAAVYGSRLALWAGLASACVGAVTIAAYLFLSGLLGDVATWSDLPRLLFVLVAALFALLLSWTSGALVRTARRAQRNRIAQQRAEEEAIAEQERAQIARDMHDVVAHSLAVVVAQADGARYASIADPDIATEALATISTTARAALADVRLLLTQLRHREAAGPQPALADLTALFGQVRAAGVDLRVVEQPPPPGVPPSSVQLAVYRILQEALTNALRHGAPGPVDVRLSWLIDRVEIDVHNGVLAGTVPGGGHGLIGMRERAQLVGGTFAATSEDGVYSVRASLPIGGVE